MTKIVVLLAALVITGAACGDRADTNENVEKYTTHGWIVSQRSPISSIRLECLVVDGHKAQSMHCIEIKK